MLLKYPMWLRKTPQGKSENIFRKYFRKWMKWQHNVQNLHDVAKATLRGKL